MLKYIELNKIELDYMMIEKFRDSLTVLKTILEEIEKIEIIRKLEIEEIEEIVEKELTKLEIEKIDELEKLQEKLRLRKIKYRFWERLNSIEKEMELREITRKKISYI